MHGPALALALALAALAPALQEAAPPAATAPLVLERSIPLPGVEGRIDHLALDPGRERLWVAALGNDTVEVVGLAAGKVERSLPASEPQGILYLAGLDRVAFTNGRAGTLDVHDAETLERVARIEVGADADNVRFDAAAKLLWVGIDGALVAVDVGAWKVAGTIPLPGHAESFQLDAAGARAFVNVPDAEQLVLVDLAAHRALREVEVDEAHANYPMAWLPAPANAAARDGLVLVGCRSPARLLVRSEKGGEPLATLELSGDTDDIFHDAERGRVYVSCGAGFVDVFERSESGGLQPLTKVATADGARTCLFVPERDTLYVAVPERAAQRAEVRVFTAR